MKLTESYPKLATWSLGLFVVSFFLHVVAFLGLLRIPILIFMLFGALIIPAHMIVVLGANGGELFPKRKQPYKLGRSWKYAFASLKLIPLPWRMFGLAFWYVYAPTAGIISFIEKNESAYVGVGVAAFSLLHFFAFRFVLPQRDLIVQSVQ